MEEDKIDELVQEENQSLSIKSSEQFFIQQHYKHVPLEQICIATGLTPEAVTEYVEEYETYLKSRGVNTDRRFQFNMGIDINGNVSYSLEWPDINSVEAVLPFVGKFFYLLNKGQFKVSMAQFLVKYAEERSAHRVVQEIMKHWNENADKDMNTPIIEPQEVFQE